MTKFDSILVLSFGGPEGKEDVLPFLKNVLRGIPLKEGTLKEIQKRYDLFDGVSPINEHTRIFIEVLKGRLLENNINIPVYLGNRNWHPFLLDTLKDMAAKKHKKTLVFVTSIFSSYSGCRKYREDLYEASEQINHSIELVKIRNGYNHPSFIQSVVECVASTLDSIDNKKDVPLLFTAHSLPLAMAQHTDYEAQLLESCRLVSEDLNINNWELCFQSNNASYGNKWLEPTIEDQLRKLKKDGYNQVVVMPLGFVCDHMEVVLDLDIDAKNFSEEIGIAMHRAPTVGINDHFIKMVIDLIQERIAGRKDKLAIGLRDANHDLCPPNCCLSGRPGPTKPSLCGLTTN
jgi:protoporphyrin/coproporphyrin ferrochelatase